jgi:hypothetical protein
MHRSGARPGFWCPTHSRRSSGRRLAENPKPGAAPKRRRASDSSSDDSGTDADRDPYAFTQARRVAAEKRPKQALW